jgi:RNA polymerase sigma factor (sigma-70 family)
MASTSIQDNILEMRQHSSGMDEAAFRLFYDSTRKSLWSYIVRSAGDATQSDDIFQDSYVRFIQSDAGALKPEQQRAYLFKIASNLLIDFYRRRKRQQPIDDDDEQMNTDHKNLTGIAMDVRHDVRKAFDQLTMQERSVLWLAYVEEYPHREIAGMLKVKEKSVKVLLFRAKQRMLAVAKNIGLR